MRKFTVVLAVLAAACSQQGPEEMNAQSEANIATDVPIEGETQPPVTPPANGAVPDQPQNGTSPAPEPSGQVALTVAPTRTSAGSAVTLTLANKSVGTVGYNLCTSALQTAAGAAVPSDRICTMELRTLDPGKNATYSYELPTPIPNGQYRFSTGVNRMPNGPGSTVRSNTFEVR